MARGRSNEAQTAGKGTKPARTAATAKGAGTKVKVGRGPTVVRSSKTKPEPEEIDLKAALPYFLARIAIFVLIAVVLWLLTPLAPLFAVLFGLIGGALAGYPLARIQKRVSQDGE